MEAEHRPLQKKEMSLAASFVTTDPRVNSQWSCEQLIKEWEQVYSLGRFSAGILTSFCLYRSLPDVLEISILASNPICRRQGHMSKLLSDINHLAGERPVWLEVESDNVAARELYRHKNWNEVGFRRDYYGLGRHGVLITST